jgi:hypothetical protein
MEIETKLVRKTATSPLSCHKCKGRISAGETFHLEEGKDKHLHSLVARHFCTNCYAKYGEPQLLKK